MDYITAKSCMDVYRFVMAYCHLEKMEVNAKKTVHSSLAAALDYMIKSLALREEAQDAEKAPIFLPWITCIHNER